MSHRIHQACHAKINLSLAVGQPIERRLPDGGLHPVCSWMTCIELHDELTITRAYGQQSSYNRSWVDGSPVAWDEEHDLAVRAHRAMETLAGRRLPVDLVIRKSIPAGGGLGGGSSNAAGVLQALVALFDLPCSAPDLVACARSLGSDVTFFIDDRPEPRPAVVSGVGDQIERIGACEAEVVLILPPHGCDTGVVYRAFDSLGFGLSFDEGATRVRSGALAGDLHCIANDLLPAAVHVYPWLAEIEDRLRRALGTTVHLSGSGSTLFMLSPSATVAEIQRIVPSCRVVGTRTL